jgi:hypothetical protein
MYFVLCNVQTLLDEWIAIRAAENGITVSQEVMYFQFPFTTILTFIVIHCTLFEDLKPWSHCTCCCCITV